MLSGIRWTKIFGEWFPDWVGNGAQTYFSPLLDGRQYTTGSTNYGDYNDPEASAFRNLGCTVCPKWENVEDAFNKRSYLDAWREVLAPGKDFSVKSDMADVVGQTWYAKVGTDTALVVAYYKDAGEDRVVYRVNSVTRRDMPEPRFLSSWGKAKPVKYVKGGLYTPVVKTGSAVTNPRIILLAVSENTLEALAAADNGITQTSPVSYWERKFGQLEPVKFCNGGSFGKRSEHMMVQL